MSRRAETAVRARIDEMTEALRESDLALEDARAEIETLRGDIAVSWLLSIISSLAEFLHQSLEAAASAVGEGEDGSEDPVSKLRAELQEARSTAQEKASANEALKEQIASLQTESGEVRNDFTYLSMNLTSSHELSLTSGIKSHYLHLESTRGAWPKCLDFWTSRLSILRVRGAATHQCARINM